MGVGGGGGGWGVGCGGGGCVGGGVLLLHKYQENQLYEADASTWKYLHIFYVLSFRFGHPFSLSPLLGAQSVDKS